MDIVEIIGAIIGLLYLLAEVKAKNVVWLLGILMPVFYCYIYFTSGLFANAGINIYYICASVYGLLEWKGIIAAKSQPSPSKEAQPSSQPSSIKCFPRKWIVPLIAVIGIATCVLTMLLSLLDESHQPLLDGFTAAMNIVGMWMLAKKYYQEWIIWIVVDPFTIVLCALSGLWPTAIMYCIYLVVSIIGYKKWKQAYLHP